MEGDSPSSTAPQLGQSLRYFESLAAKEQKRSAEFAIAARDEFIVVNATSIPTISNPSTRSITYREKFLKWVHRFVSSVKGGMKMGYCSCGNGGINGGIGSAVADPLHQQALNPSPESSSPCQTQAPMTPAFRKSDSNDAHGIVVVPKVHSEKSTWTDPLIVANKSQLFQLFSRFADQSTSIEVAGLREMLYEYRICPALCSAREIEDLMKDIRRTAEDSSSSDCRPLETADTALHLGFVGFIDVLWLIASRYIFLHPPPHTQQQLAEQKDGSGYDRVRLAMLMHLFEIGGSGATGVVFDLSVLREARASAAGRRRIDCEDIPVLKNAARIGPEQKFFNELSTGMGMSVSDETLSSSSVAKIS